MLQQLAERVARRVRAIGGQFRAGLDGTDRTVHPAPAFTQEGQFPPWPHRMLAAGNVAAKVLRPGFTFEPLFAANPRRIGAVIAGTSGAVQFEFAIAGMTGAPFTLNIPLTSLFVMDWHTWGPFLPFDWQLRNLAGPVSDVAVWEAFY